MTNKHVIAALLHKNCSDEQGAQAGYQQLISAVETYEGLDDLKEETIKVISEIQGDEFNHSCKLMALARKWDGIAPSQDDLEEAIKVIVG